MKAFLNIVLITIAGCISVAHAQQQTLPSDMVASFGANGTWAEEFWLPTGPAPTNFAKARLTYDNELTSGRVNIVWHYGSGNAGAGTQTQTFELSFRPTAIARRAGTTSTFYVVGWVERGGRIVVEKWTCGSFTLAVAMPPGGGLPVTVFIPPQISRVVEWISDSAVAPPVSDAAFQTYGSKLLLLFSGTPTKVVSLDLDTLELSVLYSSSIHSSLSGHHMISVARLDSGGFIAVTERRHTWEHGMKYSDPDLYFVMRDTNMDGIFDAVGPEPTHSLYYTYPPPWDNKYVEP